MSDESRIDTIYTAFFEQPFPADLKLALIWLAASVLVIYVPVLNETSVRAALLIPGILFLPGYCFIAALFPGYRTFDLIERVILSIGLSLILVPLIGLGLNFTPWGIRLEPFVVISTLFTLAMILEAQFRRSLLPKEERFRLPFSKSAGTIRDAIVSKEESRTGRILNIVLVVAVLTTILTMFFVIAVPKQGEEFTEFFILGEKQNAADYPDRINIGQEYPMYIGVVNHEYRPVTYTIETWGILTEYDNVTSASRVMAMDPLWQQSFSLAHNQRANVPYTLSVGKSGYNRVEFLLFNETVAGPGTRDMDRINASYRNLHLWVNVRSGYEPEDGSDVL